MKISGIKRPRTPFALMLVVLATVLLLAFTVYQTPAMQFMLDGFRLCV